MSRLAVCQCETRSAGESGECASMVAIQCITNEFGAIKTIVIFTFCEGAEATRSAGDGVPHLGRPAERCRAQAREPSQERATSQARGAKRTPSRARDRAG